MVSPKTYSDRDIEISERLAVVETKLQTVQTSIKDHRDESASRADDLHKLILDLGVKIENSKFKWSDLITKDTIKIVVYLIGSSAGVTGLVKALWD